MRATLILVIAFALATQNIVNAGAWVDCSSLNADAPANGVKCTSATGTPAKTALSCAANFVLTKTGASAYSCVAAGTTPCAIRAPISTVTGDTSNNANTCITAFKTVTDDTAAAQLWVADTATPTCASTTTNNVVTKYTTGAAVTTGTTTPFSATPLNSWQCYACPVGCDNCDPTNAGKFTPTDATKTQTQCKTAANGYFLSKDTDSNSGNAGGVCPSAITAAGAAGTYGGNASTTAAVITCTECYGTGATNCTKISGTCPKNAAGKDTTYISFADITTVGTYKVGDVTYNLSGLNTTQLGSKSLQGCYDVAALNSSYYNQATSSSTKSANIIASVSAVVIAVVASVFVF